MQPCIDAMQAMHQSSMRRPIPIKNICCVYVDKLLTKMLFFYLQMNAFHTSISILVQFIFLGRSARSMARLAPAIRRPLDAGGIRTRLGSTARIRRQLALADAFAMVHSSGIMAQTPEAF
jgi:hypothetical protein